MRDSKRKPRTGNRIYGIFCKQDNAVYVGKTTLQGKLRWHQHKYELDRQRHHTPKLQQAYNRLGIEAFEFVIIYDGVESIDTAEKQAMIEMSKCGYTLYNVKVPRSIHGIGSA